MPSIHLSADSHFDIIVIGLGSMGSATCFYLASRGYRVLGLEQFDIVHEWGAHAGQSRLIRKAYFEGTDYVPLLEKAYKNWEELESETGARVYFQTGLLYFGRPQNALIKGVRQSAALYNLPLEHLNHLEARGRFPRFHIPEDFEILFEPEAGFITPEKAILLYMEQALKKGCRIHTREKILDWKRRGTGVEVRSEKGVYHADKLVITAGPWAGKMIPSFSDKIKITRQFVAWIKPNDRNSQALAGTDDFRLGNFPCWLMADEARPGCYYGFPILPVASFGGPIGLKLAHHHPAHETDPERVDRNTLAEDEEELRYFLDKYLPGSFESFLASKICLYANSPDEHFIIDKLPGYEESVCIACGFSGHGFKFASVVGEILADLATKGETELPIGFLSANRFSV